MIVRMSQGPHSQILMTGGGVGGPTEVNILYPKQEAAGSLYSGRSNQFFVVSQ